MNNLSSHPVELIAEPISGVLAQLARTAAFHAQAGTVADPDGQERPLGTWERLRIALEYAHGLALHAEAGREAGQRALVWTDNPDGSATITDPEDGTTTHVPREINSNPLGRSPHQCCRCGMQLVVMRINPPALRCDRCRRILGKEEIADLLAEDG